VSGTPFAVAFALLGFAANSVLCRMALRDTGIDAASFTSVRLVTGAVVLMGLTLALRGVRRPGGNWWSAALLWVYAAAFSYAYLGVTTGTGALLLFGAVQVIMIAAGLRAGERVDLPVALGWLLAVAGIVVLVLPGVAAAPLANGALMLLAGGAWGWYTLRGRGSADPLGDTGGNFLRAVPAALLLSMARWPAHALPFRGVALAVLSGGIASGLGYAAWYAALPRLRAITAANLQLLVPVLAALCGVVLFDEAVTLRLVAATVCVLGGVTAATHALRSRSATPR
jgi:drug/metabolite transporter (DMT)-like permease